MRKSVHTENLHLRIARSIFVQAKERAEQRGMTVAEFTRHALRRELGEAA